MDFLFACTEEHKKELDLFIGQLLGEVFTISYFKNIFNNQFLRVLCEFLQTIVTTILKRKFDEVAVIHNDGLAKGDIQQSAGKTVQVLFVPYLNSENYEKIQEVRNKLPEECHLVVLTVFCYHIVLKRLVRIKRCTLVNLFCIANEGRFKEVLQANLRDELSHPELLSNSKLISKAESKIEQFIVRRLNGEDD